MKDELLFEPLGAIGLAASDLSRDLAAVVTAALFAKGATRVVYLQEDPSFKRESIGERAYRYADRLLGGLVYGAEPIRVPVVEREVLTVGRLNALARDERTLVADRKLDTLVIVGSWAPAAPLRSLFSACYRLRVGSAEDDDAGTYGTAESQHGRPTVGLTLEAISVSGETSATFSMSVQAHMTSASRTRSNVIASVGPFVEVAMGKLARSVYSTPTRSTPERRSYALTRILRLALAVGSRVISRHQWFLAVARRTEGPIPLPERETLTIIRPPSDRLWADPFLSVRDGRTWAFFEEAPFQSEKGRGVGRIVVAEVDGDGLKGSVLAALERPYHLSYPFVFEYEGEWFMLPESAAANRLELFKCAQWPNRWEYHRTLLDGLQVYDATMACIADRYWLFASRSAPGAVTSDHTDLYFSDSPFGPFVRHPGSPIASDVRWGRPGGRLFQHDGIWYRPAQDSSAGIYGRAIRIQRINSITPDHYEESTAHVIEPDWSPKTYATHTIDATSDLVILDGCRMHLRSPLLRPRHHRKARRAHGG